MWRDPPQFDATNYVPYRGRAGARYRVAKRSDGVISVCRLYPDKPGLTEEHTFTCPCCLRDFEFEIYADASITRRSVRPVDEVHWDWRDAPVED
jgi:hypothetical protein